MPPPPQAFRLHKLFTVKQCKAVAYYIMAAIKAAPGNMEQQRNTLLGLAQHLFNRSHDNCGEWCHARSNLDHKPARLGGDWLPDDPRFHNEVQQLYV